ncbi:MAG: hypothetical protein WA667_06390 [Candidatus Nitrosopolaris sp.]
MQNHGNIQRLIALIILNIIVLALVVVLSSFTYAQGRMQELHQRTLYEMAKYTSSTQNAHITVGENPAAIERIMIVRSIEVRSFHVVH